MSEQKPFGQITALAAAPGDSVRRAGGDGSPALFAAADTGLFISHDWGEHWQDALAGSAVTDLGTITALLAHPAEEGGLVLLAGTAGGVLRGVLQAADGGPAWEAVPFGSPPPLVTALAASADGTIHAATLEDGVFTSSSGGRAWTRWNFGLLDWSVMALAAVVGAGGAPLLLAGTTSGGIYASKNNGRTWRETGFPDADSPVLALGAAADGSVLLAGTEAGALFCSTDRGERWKAAALEGAGEIAQIVAAQGGENWSAAVLRGDELLATRDAGQTWTVLGVGVLAVTAGPGGVLLAAGEDGGVRKFVIR